MKKLIGLCLVTTGLTFLVFGVFLIYQRHAPVPAPVSIIGSVETKAQEKVARLIIKDLEIDLPIYDAQISKNIWSARSDGLNHLDTSPQPGSVGNSIIYGHNWQSLLRSLAKAKVGQTIIVIGQEGFVNNFEVREVKVVNASDVSILENTNDTRLTLYTCTGFLDSQRLVVVASDN